MGTADQPQLSGLFVAMGRAVVATALSAAFLWATGAPRPRREDLWPLALTAIGVVVGFPLFTSLAMRHVQLHEMLPEDVACALGLLEAAGTAGNLTSDAQIAAVALRLDAEVHTADLDFGRFPKVRFLNPLR